jgi:hypothetical protein
MPPRSTPSLRHERCTVSEGLQVSVELPLGVQGSLPVLLEQLRDAPTARPYSEETLRFCAAFAQRLGRATRGMPELQALAFWMRRAELHRLRDEFAALGTDAVAYVPRGIVFHIPPANVDTIFIYSWLLSLLAGNKNVIRMSSRPTPQTEIILQLLNELLGEEEHAGMRGSTLMLSYGHDEAITSAISAVADLRVIWGGDQTVDAIRRSPIAPHAGELTFPDRFSLAAVKAEAYLALDEEERAGVAERFFNDAYWFDQMGCSSPRMVVWVGSDEDTERGAEAFYERLQSVVTAKGYEVDTATAINKMTYGYRSVLDQPVTALHRFSNEMSALRLERFTEAGTDFCGAGLFFDVRLEQLTDLADHVVRRDQTLSHFGFSRGELRAFADRVNGRGIDRIVPFGQALTFGRFWDGYDLLQAFSRRVLVQVDGST